MTWGNVAGVAAGLIGNAIFGGHSGNKGPGGTPSIQQRTVYDPYAPYRGAAASALNSLMSNPAQIQNLPTYQAMQLAAARTSASQGYNGSGNALDASAMAAANAYQMQFNDLAMLSGANLNPAYAAQLAAGQGNYTNAQNAQTWGQVGNLVGNIVGGFNSGGNGTDTTDLPITIDPGQPQLYYTTPDNLVGPVSGGISGAPNPFSNN